MKIKLKLKKIDPVKAGVVQGLLLALMSVLIIIPMMLFLTASGVSQGATPYNVGYVIGDGIGMMVVLPIIYGILGFILGVIGTALFNFILSKTNGLNMEFDSDSLEIDQIGKKESELKF